MQVVIDISEEMYEEIIDESGIDTMIIPFGDIIKNGTPLPKGHGDLIDKGVYRKEFLDSRDFEPMKILDFQPVIVKADKEE